MDVKLLSTDERVRDLMARYADAAVQSAYCDQMRKRSKLHKGTWATHAADWRAAMADLENQIVQIAEGGNV